jgi:hypothetical protein
MSSNNVKVAGQARQSHYNLPAAMALISAKVPAEAQPVFL